jgi:ribosomal protein L14E/L6E/L27E
MEEGERSPNEAKSRIDAVCSDLDDNDFLAEVEEKLRNSMKRFQINLQNMAFLERVIERARMNGVYEGKIRGRALGVIELLEEGDFSSKRIKSKIYALRHFLDDKDFWAEIDEKLKNLTLIIP